MSFTSGSQRSLCGVCGVPLTDWFPWCPSCLPHGAKMARSPVAQHSPSTSSPARGSYTNGPQRTTAGCHGRATKGRRRRARRGVCVVVHPWRRGRHTHHGPQQGARPLRVVLPGHDVQGAAQGVGLCWTLLAGTGRRNIKWGEGGRGLCERARGSETVCASRRAGCPPGVHASWPCGRLLSPSPFSLAGWIYSNMQEAVLRRAAGDRCVMSAGCCLQGQGCQEPV